MGVKKIARKDNDFGQEKAAIAVLVDPKNKSNSSGSSDTEKNWRIPPEKETPEQAIERLEIVLAKKMTRLAIVEGLAKKLKKEAKEIQEDILKCINEQGLPILQVIRNWNNEEY